MKRRLPLIAVLPLVLLLPLLATGVMALGTDGQPAGTQVIVTGALSAAPSTPVVGQGSCTPGQPTRSNVSLSWTDAQYATLTPSGAALVSGYTADRATQPTGTSVPATAVSVTPPAAQPTTATDVNPTGAPATTTFVINGGGVVVPFTGTKPATPGAYIHLGKGIDNYPNTAQVTPAGTTLVVAETKGNQVQVLQQTGGVWKVVKTFTGLTNAEAVAIDPVPVGGHYVAYVLAANKGAGNPGYVVSFTLNGSSSTKGSAVAVGVVAQPAAMLVTPDGSQIYVADYTTGAVSYFPTASPPATAPTIALPGTTPEPTALVVTPDSGHVYVADWRNSVIDDISTASHTVTATIPLPAGSFTDPNVANGTPNILAMLPAGTSLYVTEYSAHQVQEVHTALAPVAPDTVAATVSLGTGSPIGMAMSPNGCTLYVAGWTNSHIFKITTWDNAESILATMTGGTADPQSLAVTADSTHLYVPQYYFTARVDVVTPTGNDTSITSRVGAKPFVAVTTPSPYWYRVTATHGLWTSDPSAVAMFSQGFNPGGWQ